MDTEKGRYFFHIVLILLSWAGICFLLYYFLWSPSSEQTPKTKETAQTEPPPSETTTQPITEQTEEKQKKSLQISFQQEEIDAAKQVVEKFIRAFYEGKRESLEGYLNQFRPYTTEEYLSNYDSPNGLGEPIKITKLMVQYLERGKSAPQGGISFNCTVVTGKGKEKHHFSTIYTLIQEDGKWKVAEEEPGLVPEG